MAVKKVPRQQPISTNASGKTPLPESSVQTPNAAIRRSEKDYHVVLKRLRESPGDDVDVLKCFYMDSSAVTSNDDFHETDPTFSGQNNNTKKQQINCVSTISHNLFYLTAKRGNNTLVVTFCL